MADPLSTRLRELIASPEPLLLPGVSDALAALVVADIGFEAVYLTGAGITNSFLGLPDLGLISLTEVAEHVERVREVVTLPIVVDADTGYGGPLNVRRAVRMLERHGANAIQLEDQVSPKRCGHFAGVEVVPIETMVEKLHAATDARDDAQLVIIARTDANVSLGIDVAIERAQTYLEHGADVAFVEAPRDEAELALIPRRIDGPVMVNMVEGGVTPLKGLTHLRAMGYSIVLYANSGLRAATKAMIDVLSHLKAAGSTSDVLDAILPWEERQALVKKDELIRLAEGYAVADNSLGRDTPSPRRHPDKRGPIGAVEPGSAAGSPSPPEGEPFEGSPADHDAKGRVGALCEHLGDFDSRGVRFVCVDEYLPSVFPVTALAAAAVGASTLAAAKLAAARRGDDDPRDAAVDGRHAVVAFRSERYLGVDGAPASGVWEPLSRNYLTGDGRWFLLHANMPPHREAALQVLKAEGTPESVGSAIARWTGEALEDALAAAGGCGAMSRQQEEWRRHPQAQAIRALPVVEIDRIGDAPPPVPPRPGRAPRALRVLDLTRVIAGPVATRTLAAHGAAVLRVGAPHLWDHPTLVVDTGFGKRSTNLDLRSARGMSALHRLARGADVVVQGYRPGSLAARGLAPEPLAAARPGVVFVSISAYGRLGPWSMRRGFDSLVQMASGVAAAGGAPFGDGRVVPLPAQALDHTTGYLAAFGAMTALRRRYQEGGSWHVQVSLARTATWLTSQGLIDELSLDDPGPADIADLIDQMTSPFGALRYVRPPGWIEGMPPRWTSPPRPLGSDVPRWAP